MASIQQTPNGPVLVLKESALQQKGKDAQFVPHFTTWLQQKRWEIQEQDENFKELNMPTLIMTHNKTLAAQLYSEFKTFFPKNHVEYFISYYDYYQPEAYIPREDVFIEKDSSINNELERLRVSATASLLQYDDVIVIASVSANYGLGSPYEYQKMVLKFEIGDQFNQKELMLKVCVLIILWDFMELV